MKKMILTLTLTTVLATTGAKAQQVRTCVGGTEFQGAVNGHYYCKGPAMTWWAAFAWCQKQGRHLASLDEACADWRNDTSDVHCPNMKVAKDINGTNMTGSWMWTANPYSNNDREATNVDRSSGKIGSDSYRGRDKLYQALCY